MGLFSQERFSPVYGVVAILGTVAGALAMPIVTSSFATEVVTGGETEVRLNLQPVLGLYLSSSSFVECSTDTMATNGLATPVTLNTSSATTCSGASQNRTIAIDVLPGASTVATATMDARVMTNSSEGYQLYISTPDGATTQSLTKTGETRQIAPVAGTSASPVTTANFGTNAWGVSVDSGTTWFGVPSYANMESRGLLKTGKAKGTTPETYGPTTSASAAAGSETTTITFGAKVDSSMPSGAYTGTVLITAVTVE